MHERRGPRAPGVLCLCRCTCICVHIYVPCRVIAACIREEDLELQVCSLSM
jgi:hypothetical protein